MLIGYIIIRVNCSDGLCGFTFFTFSPQILKIACMLPMVCHFVTRIVPYSGDYPSNKMTNHREHTCYLQTN
ncbi:hypothetical protein Hanom_Chr04g00290151 [Helianthus anomalus]